MEETIKVQIDEIQRSMSHILSVCSMNKNKPIIIYREARKVQLNINTLRQAIKKQRADLLQRLDSERETKTTWYNDLYRRLKK